MEESDPKPESLSVKEPKKIARSRVKEKAGKEKSLLLMELAEIKEISDIIFEKIEKQIEVLKTIEASVDQKIATLRRLKQGGAALEKQPEEAARLSEIRSLSQKGLGVREIADMLKMPAGEVDLMINLAKNQNDIPDFSDGRQREQEKIPEKQLRQKTGSHFLSRRIVFVLSFIILTAAVAVYLFVRQRDSVPLTPSSKSDGVVAQQQLPPIQAQPVEEEKPQDIDSIRKKYSLASEPQTIEKEFAIKKGDTIKEEDRPIRPVRQKKLRPFRQKKQGNTVTIVTIVTTAATIRGKPDLGSPPVAWVLKGAVLDVKEDFTDDAGKKWYGVVISDGRKGWIADNVVKPSS